MKIESIQSSYYSYCKSKQIANEDLKPMQPISNINPSMQIPDNAYIWAMETLGTNIDIKI